MNTVDAAMKVDTIRNIRFTDAEWRAVNALADERCCSAGAVVRWAVRQQLQAAIAEIEKQTNGTGAH